ncbi:N-carbamoyl-L-amino-acid hydrolase [Silvibacterium bohemicum]|uniref:N-carbamoyl-L-amino-acid hydrolase n=1 Tax=Silvibacterium bohemicum TaxID=1577686 RepID=A0A841JXJ5_9BACT|nr:M20 family metallo-hydrolase [Silvibacterium bohemicum]MBB6146133.1 N-carbamoyl-L-amino-acid hydrolase [Silvibacterium bohemicum]
MNFKIDQQRLNRELDTLASFSADPAPAVTRVVFSEQDLAARAWIKERFREAGLTMRDDAVGNTFARWAGANPDLPAVGTGSHIDAIPHAGKFDGTVGVLGSLEAIRALQAAGFKPRRSIELVLFTAEEPTRFGIGCLGSRVISGSLTPAADVQLREASAGPEGHGQTLESVRKSAGFTGSLDSALLPQNYFSAFIELHIEQGSILESEGVSVGLVSDIAAPAAFHIVIEGEGGHAGARLMPGRKDALCAAAEIILAVERSVLATGATDTVGTVGICQVHPGAMNSIPSRVQLSLDLRDTDAARRDAALEQIHNACGEIASRRRVAIKLETINADAPAQSSPEIVKALKEACDAEAVSYRTMVSRAYHDTLFMARLAPVAMMFIPCKGGVSHRPDEYSSPEQIHQGVKVLARVLAGLSAI